MLLKIIFRIDKINNYIYSVIFLLFICCILFLFYKFVLIKNILYNVELKFKVIFFVDDGLRVVLSVI